MICINLSKVLGGDLKTLVGEHCDAEKFELNWFAHRVNINRRKCIIVVEVSTRYAMIFTGLVKKDFQNFSQIFAERLWRELLDLLQLSDKDSARISDTILDCITNQHFQLGHDRSVNSHITQIVGETNLLIEYREYPFPESTGEAMHFGTIYNRMLRKTGKHKGYFYPGEEFAKLWTRKLGIADTDDTNKDLRPLGYDDENVIKVDFATGG